MTDNEKKIARIFLIFGAVLGTLLGMSLTQLL
jgi:hypothetical protein